MRKKVNKESFNKVIEYFKKADSWLLEYIEQNPDKKIDNETLGFDYRDFGKLSVYYAGMVETKEEYFSATNKLFDKIVNHKEEFLNEYFDLYEKIDYKNLKYDTVENCFDSLVTSRLSQFNSNTLAFNKDFREKRYSKDTESMIKYDQLVANNASICSADTILVGIDTETNLNNYDREYLGNPFDEFILENFELGYTFPGILDYEKGNTDKVKIGFPDYAYYGDKIISQDTKDVPAKYNNFASLDTLVTSYVRAFNSPDGYAKEFLGQNISDEIGLIYIDGVSLADIVRDEDKKKHDICGLTLANAIKEGKAIDVAACYKDKNGVVNTKIYPLDITPSKEIKAKIDNEYFSTKHSWFRLTFFNWGPFKIKEKGLFEDKALENDKNKASREQNILKSNNERLIKFASSKGLDIKPGKLIEKEKDNFISKTFKLDISDNEISNENEIINDNKKLDLNELTKSSGNIEIDIDNLTK